LFAAISTPHGGSAIIALAITAMAFGVMVAGISLLLVPWLARLTTARSSPKVLHARQLDFRHLYTRPEHTLQIFQHHMRVYQAYANMATALLISLVVLLYNIFWDHQLIDHWQFKIPAF